ncbi:MAG: hypothetical protein CL872_07370 [Dehalococcoidaceae bacterium]|nr:hypothetical protein [Dehalococcoidaceae bacterium]
MSSDEKAGICHNCKGKNIARFVFGLPSQEFLKEYRKEENQGKFVLGGCCVSNDDPKFVCNDCSYEWRNVVNE